MGEPAWVRGWNRVNYFIAVTCCVLSILELLIGNYERAQIGFMWSWLACHWVQFDQLGCEWIV